MRYPDLVEKAKQLPVGKHVLYGLKSGRVIFHNVGVRHPYLANHDEYRVLIQINGNEYCPRHADLFTDFLLKLDVQPDQRVKLTDACELVCNEASPSDVITRYGFPTLFAKVGQETWTYQTSAYQTGGLPTELLFYGLQVMILVYHMNDPALHASEAFRKVFVDLSHAIPLHEAVRHLQPQVRPGKRYFDRLDRTPKPSI
jgi:hypothetical protein